MSLCWLFCQMSEAEEVLVMKGKACSRCAGGCPGFELHYWR